LGAIVDMVYGAPAQAARVETWVAIYAYAFQIYFDFSGYTDMAWGLAGLLGFRLPVNFDHPYLAESPREFWRRWHVSLSTWLRDYLYVGLGGNRRGSVRTHVNLLGTMALGGLWHGAAWTFVLWGVYHGFLLSMHRLVSAHARARTPVWLRRLVTFHLVALGWVLFRSSGLQTAVDMLRGLLVPRPLDGGIPIVPIALVLVGCATHAVSLRIDVRDAWRAVPRVVQGMAYGVAVIAIGLWSAQSQRFIYFQF
jgi:D-alanyl-lipoteichoic acid acyltransferase DltB (MBOAT superfamily)